MLYYPSSRLFIVRQCDGQRLNANTDKQACLIKADDGYSMLIRLF
ncbi:hypothetical protein ACF3NV_04955 [Moraxella atlantae]